MYTRESFCVQTEEIEKAGFPRHGRIFFYAYNFLCVISNMHDAVALRLWAKPGGPYASPNETLQGCLPALPERLIDVTKICINVRAERLSRCEKNVRESGIWRTSGETRSSRDCRISLCKKQESLLG